MGRLTPTDHGGTVRGHRCNQCQVGVLRDAVPGTRFSREELEDER